MDEEEFRKKSCAHIGCFAEEACKRKALVYCICYQCKHQEICWGKEKRGILSLVKPNMECFESEYKKEKKE